MKIKKTFLIVFLLCSANLFGQGKESIIGTWVKDKEVEIFSGQTVNRDVTLKFTFESEDRGYLSTELDKKGYLIYYRVDGEILDLGTRKFRIEKLDQFELVLEEQGENPPTHLIFKNNQEILNRLEFSADDYYLLAGDTIYYESDYLYPDFEIKKYADIRNYLQPFAEGKSNIKEAFLFCTFIVNTDGSIQDIGIHHHIYKSYDKTFRKQLAKTSGSWSVPIINGKPVRVLKEVSIHYLERPHMKTSRGKIIITEKKKRNYNDSYQEAFIQAIRNTKKNNTCEAIKLFNRCDSLLKNEPNIDYQLYLQYGLAGEPDKRIIHYKRVKDSRLKYLIED